MSPAALMLAAWAIEIAFGWPNWLFRLIRHPVVWFGILVRWLVKAFNQDGWPHTTRYIAGMVASLFAISLATASAWLIAERLPNTRAASTNMSLTWHVRLRTETSTPPGSPSP